MKNKNSITLVAIIGLMLMLANACKKNDAIAIGKRYQGGIIAYILQPSDSGYNASTIHGLIAAPSDQSSDSGIVWWNGTDTTTGATRTAIGSGKSNTAAIIASQGAGTYAATICTALTLGGYTDWYLPSKDELNELYLNQAAIGGFHNYAAYWSSTEYSSNYAGEELFGTGGLIYNAKYQLYSVRAVRSF